MKRILILSFLITGFVGLNAMENGDNSNQEDVAFNILLFQFNDSQLVKLHAAAKRRALASLFQQIDNSGPESYINYSLLNVLGLDSPETDKVVAYAVQRDHPGTLHNMLKDGGKITDKNVLKTCSQNTRDRILHSLFNIAHGMRESKTAVERMKASFKTLLKACIETDNAQFFKQCCAEDRSIFNMADLNALDSDMPVLSQAASAGSVQTVKMLVEELGADVNKVDFVNCTAAYKAALYNHREIVNYLIQHGADVNLKPDEKSRSLTQILADQDEERANSSECVICMTLKPNGSFVTLPCNAQHKLCLDCRNGLKQDVCPFCRAKI